MGWMDEGRKEGKRIEEMDETKREEGDEETVNGVLIEIYMINNTNCSDKKKI